MKTTVIPQMLFSSDYFTSPYSVNPLYDRMPEVPAEQRSEFWAS